MSWDLRDLYQETILDHQKHPRGKGNLPDATHSATGFNPLCGDKVTIQLRINDGKIDEIRFDGEGCAICMSSASMMTVSLQGTPVSDAEDLFQRIQKFLTANDESAAMEDIDSLGDLAALGGVRRLPVRIKCANLPWHTFNSAVHGEQNAKTE